eukprot:10022567-Alexandrium_andersonii.AAC.1
MGIPANCIGMGICLPIQAVLAHPPGPPEEHLRRKAPEALFGGVRGRKRLPPRRGGAGNRLKRLNNA